MGGIGLESLQVSIYWVCPKPAAPSGGAWFIHRLARLHGDAVVQLDPFDVWWDYQAARPVIYADGVVPGPLAESDVMVIPEVLWQTQKHYHHAPCRKVVFVQNYIWASHNPDDYVDCELVTCSRFLDNWCRRVLGKTPLGLLSPYLDDGPWHVTGKVKDRTLILTRRNRRFAEYVAGALDSDGFPVDLVDEPLSQLQLMEHFATAEFYVHHVAPEGFPMICAEAMRAGTIVCGTTGGGGNEFMFHRETAMVVQDPVLGHYDDEDEFARRILEQMRMLREETDLRSKLWQQANNWIGNRYSEQRTREQLKAVLG